jgi:hypothetical protein
VAYLAEATRFLGNAELERIEQLGERPDAYAQDFEVLDTFRPLKLRAT